MSRYVKIVLLVFLFLSSVSAKEYSGHIEFKFVTDFPKDTVWIKKLLRDSTKELNKMFAPNGITLPKRILVTLKKDTRLNGIRGNAGGNNTINFKSNMWQKDKYRIWILVHELTNLLVSHYGSGGYPSDWWSNGRSPFPTYATYLVMKKLGFNQEAKWLLDQNKHIPDQKFYFKLHQLYGTKLFKEFFSLMKEYKIDLRKIGKRWPAPDKQRSLVTLSVLSMAANKNLANLARVYKIGERPKDWHRRHPEMRFYPYSITPKEIEQTIGDIYLQK